jgi:alcohol dehydrogenase class IV
MAPFEFTSVSKIIFGRGKFSGAPALAATLGKNTLLIFNGQSNERRIESFAAGLTIHPLRQRGEPVVSQIETALTHAHRVQCDCVIGLGGGSAIDTAKAVAGLLTNGGSPIDYMEVVGQGKKISKPAAPWMAIPTTAGTGAEATRNAVIGLPEKKFKASIRSEHLLPRIALIDPDLGMDVPPEITAASGMDALCQLIESYTSTGASPMTDPLALRGIELAAANLLTAFRNPDNPDARQAMALAALLSGITLTNAGLGAVHGFAAPIGANFPIPHGVICAALLPHIIRANIRALKSKPEFAHALARYATIGKIVNPENEPLNACIDFTQSLTRQMNIPALSVFGLSEKQVPEMVSLATKTSSMRFNPVKLSEDQLAAALRSAIVGG